MRILFVFCIFLFTTTLFSQENSVSKEVPRVKIDSLYREDQFYFSYTLNTLQKKPKGLSQDKFSSGYSLGFLRDFPLNKKRTIAIAPGIGLALNNYNHNLKISEVNETLNYEILQSNVRFDRNKFSQLIIEAPIELRWRNSNFESHKFWRVYTGFKIGYLLNDKALYVDSFGKKTIKNNDDFNAFQYGTYISVGYNSINIYAYYGLNSFFRSAKIASESIDMNSLNLGLMFYIL